MLRDKVALSVDKNVHFFFLELETQLHLFYNHLKDIPLHILKIDHSLL